MRVSAAVRLTLHEGFESIARVERGSVETIIRALNEVGVRYLIAGGLAVVAHGYVRFTADVDLIVDLSDENLRRFLRALDGLGYRPRAPVSLTDFADPAKRREWVDEKGLTVFSVSSPAHAATEIDIFVELPLDFEQAYARSALQEVAPTLEASFVSYEDLVSLKKKAGRPQDIDDLAKLAAARRNTSDG